MQPIRHTSPDKKLQTALDKFNDRVQQHLQTAKEIEAPPDIADDALVLLTVENLEAHLAGLTSEQLAHRQNAVALSRTRIELTESCDAELQAIAADAETFREEIIAKTSKQLEKIGAGVAMTPAGKIGYERAAERQFSSQVQQCAPVREATEAATVARRRAQQHRNLIGAAKAGLQDSMVELRKFVATHLS